MTDLEWAGQKLTRAGRRSRILDDLAGRKWISQRNILKDVALAQEFVSRFVV
jgi:hypothetical protein